MKEDVLGAARNDHWTISRMFQQFETLRDKEKRSFVFDRVSSEVRMHLSAEREVLYAVLRNFDITRPRCESGMEEHKEIEGLLGLLRDKRFGDNNWNEMYRDLRLLVESHFFEEEDKLFVGARRVLSGEQLERLAPLFEMAKHKYAKAS